MNNHISIMNQADNQPPIPTHRMCEVMFDKAHDTAWVKCSVDYNALASEFGRRDGDNVIRFVGFVLRNCGADDHTGLRWSQLLLLEGSNGYELRKQRVRTERYW